MKRRLPRWAARVGGALLAVAALGCNAATEAHVASKLVLVHGPSPVGVPGWPLLDTIVVQVFDQQGSPLRNRMIDWHVGATSGTLELLDSVTTQAGTARARWTLGALPGTNRITAVVGDDSLVITVEGSAFRVDSLASSFETGCGLRSGDLWCWAWPGGGAPSSQGPPSWLPTTFNSPALLSAGRSYVTLAVGDRMACAITASHQTDCFANRGGVPVIVPQVPPLWAIAAGEAFGVCGLAVADSTAWCWKIYDPVATQVPGSPAFTSLSLYDPGSGGAFQPACGLLVDSTAACWGLGPVGDGTTQDRTTPTPVSGQLRFVQLATGYRFACGRQAGGDVWCWGKNQSRVLGTGGDALTPVLMAKGIVDLAITDWTVGVIQGWQVKRWGMFGSTVQSDYLGNPLTALAPVPAGPAVRFAKGGSSCFQVANGGVYCYHDFWVQASTIDIDLYLAIQPVRE